MLGSASKRNSYKDLVGTWIPARHCEADVFCLDEAKGRTMICLNVFRTFRFEPSSAVSCTRSFNPRLIPSAGESDSHCCISQKALRNLSQAQFTAKPRDKTDFTQLPAPHPPSGPLCF